MQASNSVYLLKAPWKEVLKRSGISMESRFAKRAVNTQKSFIREILKVTESPEIISFAGGLPNPCSFPVEGITKAAGEVLSESGSEVLQYTTTEGYYPLRKFIADRYRNKKGFSVEPEEILITNGSQQALDLIGKVFLDKGDKAAIERPGYLGAIQAFSMFEPELVSISLENDGIDVDILENQLKKGDVKLLYTVPNFQNPSGITYSLKKRIVMSFTTRNYGTFVIEDDAYGELRFAGEDLPLIRSMNNENVILLGSFSKIVSPGLRVGWICASKDIIEKLVVAKQASDLHSNYLAQRIIYKYISGNDIESHITKIKGTYKMQRNLMVSLIEQYFPEEIKCTRPEGGMFVWLTLPERLSALEIFHKALEKKVAFVPGTPFYVDGGGENTIRLNFSNSDEDRIDTGIKRLADIFKTVLR
jgi:2-aminoadipate transaminase